MNIIYWLIIFIVLLIIEIATVSLFSIWFCLGCLGAIAAGFFGCGLSAQIGVFAVVSGVSLFAAVPLKKKVKASVKPTNVNSLVGRETCVLEDIDNLKEQGSIKLNDVIWTARSSNGEAIPKGTKVVINEIKGVKAFVSEIKEVNR
ncbi:MAG: NfeD family protein [Clostridiales bacterium]|nr:NfeD family protein [Clostridiales bacterium]